MTQTVKAIVRSLFVLAQNLVLDLAIDGRLDKPEVAIATLRGVADQLEGIYGKN